MSKNGSICASTQYYRPLRIITRTIVYRAKFLGNYSNPFPQAFNIPRLVSEPISYIVRLKIIRLSNARKPARPLFESYFLLKKIILLTTRLLRYLLLVMSDIFFIFLRCTIYSINLNTCRVVQSKDSFIILLTSFPSILIVVTYKIIFISFNIHQFTRYWTFTFVILCNNLYSFFFLLCSPPVDYFRSSFKKKKKKGKKDKR